jgi:hypothetical protein
VSAAAYEMIGVVLGMILLSWADASRSRGSGH